MSEERVENIIIKNIDEAIKKIEKSKDDFFILNGNNELIDSSNSSDCLYLKYSNKSGGFLILNKNNYSSILDKLKKCYEKSEYQNG